MKKQILCIAILLIASAAVSAQTGKLVEKIDKVRADISEKARVAETDDDQGEFGPLFVNELTVNSRNHQWRAVGIHRLNFRFFYEGGDSEDHMFPDRLVLVKTERRESNRTYFEQFLYNDAGTLIFYSQKAENDDQTPAERRVYFSGIKAIRIVEDAKTRDKLTVKDAAITKAILAESAKLKDLFSRSIQL